MVTEESGERFTEAIHTAIHSARSTIKLPCDSRIQQIRPFLQCKPVKVTRFKVQLGREMVA